MPDKPQDFRPVWVSKRTFEKLLQITNSLMKMDGRTRNPDKAIDKLVEFWEEYKYKS